MSGAHVAPHRVSRLISLFLSFAFGIIGFALGINALVKSNDQKDAVKKSAPSGATVDINTDDVFDAGAVITAFCAALAVVSIASFVFLVISLPSARQPTPLSTRTLPLQAAFLSFFTVAIFAALVPMTDFVANRQAKVTASIGGVSLPPSFIQTVEDALGVTPVYHEIGYLRLAVIFPWIAFLFGVTSSVLSLLGASSARRRPVTEETASDTAVARSASDEKHVDIKAKEIQA